MVDDLAGEVLGVVYLKASFGDAILLGRGRSGHCWVSNRGWIRDDSVGLGIAGECSGDKW